MVQVYYTRKDFQYLFSPLSLVWLGEHWVLLWLELFSLDKCLVLSCWRLPWSRFLKQYWVLLWLELFSVNLCNVFSCWRLPWRRLLEEDWVLLWLEVLTPLGSVTLRVLHRTQHFLMEHFNQETDSLRLALVHNF